MKSCLREFVEIDEIFDKQGKNGNLGIFLGFPRLSKNPIKLGKDIFPVLKKKYHEGKLNLPWRNYRRPRENY